MNDDEAIRQEWETLLAAHRELVSAYLQALDTHVAPLIAVQVRATTVQISVIARLLGLSLEGERT